VKLVREEPESDALDERLRGAELVACDLVLTEVPRAVRRAAADDPRLPLDVLIARVDAVLGAVALHPVDRDLLMAAGALDAPRLRTLDAVHVVAAARLSPVDGFVTYDGRQAAVARLAGLAVVAPAGSKG